MSQDLAIKKYLNSSLVNLPSEVNACQTVTRDCAFIVSKTNFHTVLFFMSKVSNQVLVGTGSFMSLAHISAIFFPASGQTILVIPVGE